MSDSGGIAANKTNSHYYNLKVKEVVRETEDAISIVFDPEVNIDYKSGQFLTIILPFDGKKVRRAYSLCSSPFTDSNPAVMVKRVEGGLMSDYLNTRLKAGDILEVMEPMGNFTTEFSIENKRHIIMFGGGSGITPLISIIKSTLNQEPESILTLIYCNRNIDSVIFRDQLENLQKHNEGRLQVIHILDDAPVNWQGPSGLLNHEMLQQLIERIPNWGPEKTVYLMCGPEGMMNNVETLLEKRGIPREKIFKESFVAGTIGKEEKQDSAMEEGEGKDYDVTVIYDGEEYTFEVKAGQHILETALDRDIDLPFSCQSGLCTACRGKLISGKIKMDEDEGLSEAEKSEGYVLTCVGRPISSDVKIQIG
ncbi:MAG TPA: ferredoxin--NADP reductase [Cyclobacteriaceae bacterium]|jgi:ring-1,2-phenylacetyl-CoA epoxidase subunit PaaE